ncbi:MAG: gamma-glutamyltransferase family protein, partial [Candidatus Kariarchaeaceae archaeon]
MKTISRRSAVYAKRGIVATSQPLAVEAGMRILQLGGNAADAAVATAAALNVTEPTSTGIGGDCFALFYHAKDRRVYGVNGSGRAPNDLSLDRLRELGFEKELPRFNVNTVTVPGAAAGWVDTISKFGSLEMKSILKPATELASDGFPVAPLTAMGWARGVDQLNNGPNAEEMLIDGRAPQVGQIMKIPNLAKTFTEVADHGKAGFYEGRVAESIIELIQSMGGVMSLDDLKNHRSTYDDPISVNYRGIDVFEIPPNAQGITALIALNILEEFELEGMDPSSPEYLHLLIEAMRIAFADTRHYVADPSMVDVPIEGLLTKEYARSRRELLNLEKTSVDVKHGSPLASSDT